MSPASFTENSKEEGMKKIVDEFLFDMMKSSAVSKDPAEEELKKRKKRKSR